MPPLDAKRATLLELITSYGSCAVALSGGVDSSVVAKAAQLALGARAIAVTGVSPSLATGELEFAQTIARQIGIRHTTIQTEEINDPAYAQNGPDRCYHCKTNLYLRLGEQTKQLAVAVIANGANADDLSDYRPGSQAAHERAVRSPLAECSITKHDVRELARAWDLPVWDKPAAPCLASRVAYGEAVTPERLAMIDRAEQFLRALGLREVRVRYHRGDLARLEVPAAAVAQLAEPDSRNALVAELRELGFKYVTLDLEGLRSGSMNDVLPVEVLERSASSEI